MIVAPCSCKEIDATCRQLIRDHVRWCQKATDMYGPSPCVHGDVTEILPEGTVIDQGYLKMSHAVNQAQVMPKQFCYTHNQQCRVFGRRAVHADYDISGLPCPDMSRAGKQLFEEGPTAVVFACHAKMHAHKRTKLLVIENVPDARQLHSYVMFLVALPGKRSCHLPAYLFGVEELRLQMIQHLYGRNYDIVQLMVSPADQGHHGVARARTYLVLSLKGVVGQTRSVEAMYSEVSKFISGLIKTRPRDYFISDRVDIMLEATRTAATRRLPLREVPLI